MIELRQDADLFTIADVDALVNPVNTQGVMGKGLALAFKRRFPQSYKAYRAACQRGELQPGVVLFVPGQKGEPNVLHFPTKKHWRGKSRLEWIASGLDYLRDHYAAWGLTRIAMPQIGCGLGGLEWPDVQPLIEQRFAEEPLHVIVTVGVTQRYEPRIPPQSGAQSALPAQQQPLITDHRPLTSDHPMPYPKRLIEVDLPIRRISAHARREKSIRHGHISTLHIWWARRPLAACRAVICAALWPDPADPHCPPAFRLAATRAVNRFAARAMSDKKLAATASEYSMGRWNALTKEPLNVTEPGHWNVLRYALLDFIADFANWDNSANPAYLETARELTQAAHEALGGQPGTRPLVVDPFAGGGAIPLEALRVGADAFASDLNPVAVLLNKVVLEYIPRYGQTLADEVRQWGGWIKEQAEKELAAFYPPDPDGATPIAYLWARTVTCEGPGCGAEVPLIRSLWLAKRQLAKRGNGSVGLRLLPDAAARRVAFDIIVQQGKEWVSQADRAVVVAPPGDEGTVRRGAASCPVCGYTTPVESVRAQLKARRGGAADARLFAVVTTQPGQTGRFYRLPTERDTAAARAAAEELARRVAAHTGELSLVPDEPLDIRGIRHTWAMIYGFENWGFLFAEREALVLAVLGKLVRSIDSTLGIQDSSILPAVKSCLALAASRQTDYTSTLTRWSVTRETLGNTFGRQALPMIWDFAEVNPFSDSTGNFGGAIDWVVRVCESNAVIDHSGTVDKATATKHPLPHDSAQAYITDPPYYDAVPYAYLSDFFYVWLRRMLGDVHKDLFAAESVPKDEEIVVDRPHELSHSTKDIAFYERELTKAFAEGQRILAPNGIGVIVFASKTTASWEAILQAVVNAGWTITGSWPIDTEMEARVAAQGQSRLASSVHLVCRPREDAGGNLTDSIGDWREVLSELPARIHEWLPRLAREGVVGADALFACLGPALEIFSRYSRVERANGEAVTLGEYLEQVWAAVSKEALAMIFAGADTTGFEEDARLTAAWLWTLSAAEPVAGDGKPVAGSGYALEYDAARKIAQGLGVHLEQLPHLVEVKGGTAVLLPVARRARYLLGQDNPDDKRHAAPPDGPRQLSWLESLPVEEAAAWAAPEPIAARGVTGPGGTTLDRVHHSMLLFAAGQSDALRRFLVDGGIGADERFWRLAQAFSALYPVHSDEKRWVDGVLARKKGLGF